MKRRRALSYASVLRALQFPQLRRLVLMMPKHDVLSLVWQVLSQPQLVDGPSASSPAAVQRFIITLSQQLQLEMLAEWLEPEGVQSSRAVHLMLGRISILSMNRNYWRGFVVHSLPGGLCFVCESRVALSGCPAHSGTTTCGLSGLVDFLLAPLNGTPLFALLAKHQSPRITLRQSSDNSTTGPAIMKRFTTAHPLRCFVQVIIQWATISRVKLEVDFIQESTTSGPMHSGVGSR